MKRTRKPLTKIQRHAKGQPCYLMVPTVHRDTAENEDVVLCHEPHPGRAGMRKDDHRAAPGCRLCHDYLDYRGNRVDVGMTPLEIWHPAVIRWQDHLITMGYMKVEGIDPRPPTVRDF